MWQWQDSDLIGGHPALDFLNTVSDTGKTRQETRLASWRDYLAWLQALQVRPAGAVAAVGQPAMLKAIHDLREAAYDVLHDLAMGTKPDGDALARLQVYLQAARRCATLQALDGALVWTVPPDDRHAPIDQLALLIDDLLCRGDLHRLRECGRCTWLFLDTGRGSGRRWCDMRKCGNRAKSESFRTRHSAH